MKPYRINNKNDGIYFCTDTIISFAHTFVNRDIFEIITNSLKFCQKEKGLKVYAYVIITNHVHTIISANNGMLSEVIRDYKQFTSRRITETLRQQGNLQLLTLFQSAAGHDGGDSRYRVWQKGFHPQLMDCDEKLLQKVEYIHNNPVRKGYVDKPEHWVYSSARNYILNDNLIIDIQNLWQEI